MDECNITHRKTKAQSQYDLSRNLDENDSTLFDSSMHSLPNTPMEDPELGLIKLKLETLAINLESAHMEIDKLLDENRELKKALEQSTKNENILRKLLNENNSKSPIRTPKGKITKGIPTKSSQQKKTVPQTSNPEKKKQHTLNHKTQNNSCNSSKKPLVTKQTTPCTDTVKPNVIITKCNIESFKQSEQLEECNLTEIDNLKNHINVEESVTLTDELTNITADTDTHVINCSSNINKGIFEVEEPHKNKIVIIADDQGHNLQRVFQKLTGEQFQVSCFWKPGANMREVLTTQRKELKLLSKYDFVIVLAGTNDFNPREFQFWTQSFIYDITNTNILFTSVPFNSHLSISKLNYELKFCCNITSNMNNISFVDITTNYWPYKRNSFLLYKCQVLLKEVLRLNYKIKYEDYISRIDSQKRYINTLDKCTQTDLNLFVEPVKTPTHIIIDETTQEPLPNTSKCFRAE